MFHQHIYWTNRNAASRHPFGVGFILTLLLSAICPAFGGTAIAGDNPIRIGATLPLTGDFEYYGQSARLGAATRVKMLNDAGGVNGRRIEVEWRDNRSDPEQAKRDVAEFAEKFKVNAVIGPVFSDAAIAVRDTAKKAGVVVVSLMASSKSLSKDNPWIFRLGFTGEDESKSMTDFQMRAFGAVKCGIAFDSRRTFAREMTETFAKTFTDAGGQVVGTLPLYVDGDNVDVKGLTKLAAAGADFIFCATYALEAAEVIHAAKAAAIDTRFCAPYTWDTEVVYDASGKRLAGTCITSALFEKEFNYRPFQTFYTALEEAGMDNPDGPAANAYDAVSLLAEAMKNSDAPEDIRKALLAVKRLPLATGRTTINPDGSAKKTLILRIVEIIDGRLTPVYAERFDP